MHVTCHTHQPRYVLLHQHIILIEVSLSVYKTRSIKSAKERARGQAREREYGNMDKRVDVTNASFDYEAYSTFLWFVSEVSELHSKLMSVNSDKPGLDQDSGIARLFYGTPASHCPELI